MIAYRFPKPTAVHPAAVQLVVSLDSETDELPPATYAFPVARRTGEIEHPLKLEEGPYRVVASAADGAGNSSDTASAQLA